MTKAPLLLILLAVPAAADPAAMSATLEALRSQAAADPASIGSQEGASAKAGKSFDQNFTITTLAPVEYVMVDGRPSQSPPPKLEEKVPPKKEAAPVVGAPAPSDGSGADYYFEGKQPVNGITIYTPKKGEGSTAGGAAPTEKYGTYGKIAVAAGAALIVAGLLLGGGPAIALGIVGGLLLGAGAVLSFLFGKKK